MQLGQQGAKELLLSHSDECAQISLPEAELDIDEQADIERLNANKRGLIFARRKHA